MWSDGHFTRHIVAMLANVGISVFIVCLPLKKCKMQNKECRLLQSGNMTHVEVNAPHNECNCIKLQGF